MSVNNLSLGVHLKNQKALFLFFSLVGLPSLQPVTSIFCIFCKAFRETFGFSLYI